MTAKLQINSHLADCPRPVISDYLTALTDFCAEVEEEGEEDEPRGGRNRRGERGGEGGQERVGVVLG